VQQHTNIHSSSASHRFNPPVICASDAGSSCKLQWSMYSVFSCASCPIPLGSFLTAQCFRLR
jgi:hypothetical protein